MASELENSSPWRGGIRALLQIVLTVGLTWLIVDRIGLTLGEMRSIDAALPAPSVSLLAISVVVLFGGFLFSTRLWGRLVVELGGSDPGLWASARIVLTANLGRYLPGKLWQVAGLAVLSQRAGIPATVGTAAAILAQIFGLVGAAILAFPLLLSWSGGEGALAVSLPSVLRFILRLGFGLTRTPVDTLPAPGWGFGPRWLLAHLVLWGAYGIAFLLFVQGLGLTASASQVVPPFAAAYLLGYLALFAPAGIGVREGFLIAFLRPELGAAAVGVAILARVWMTIVELIPTFGLALWELFRSPESGRAGEEKG